MNKQQQIESALDALKALDVTVLLVISADMVKDIAHDHDKQITTQDAQNIADKIASRFMHDDHWQSFCDDIAGLLEQ
jgi:hypothetical protein